MLWCNTLVAAFWCVRGTFWTLLNTVPYTDYINMKNCTVDVFAYLYNRGIFLCMYFIQHCFICRPSDSTVSEDAGIEPRTVATSALAVRRSCHLATSHPHSASSYPLRLDLIHGWDAYLFAHLDDELSNILIYIPTLYCFECMRQQKFCTIAISQCQYILLAGAIMSHASVALLKNSPFLNIIFEIQNLNLTMLKFTVYKADTSKQGFFFLWLSLEFFY